LQGPGSGGAGNTPSLAEAVRPSSPSSAPADSGIASTVVPKLSALAIHDDQPVIIPNHLQVTESDRSNLSFGDFGPEFGKSLPEHFASEDASKGTISAAESLPVSETSIEPSAASR
jgi:hypothetical protein